MANLREVYKLYFTDFNSYFVLDLLFGLYVYRHTHTHTHGFSDSSVGKKCNVGDPGLIPGLGTSTGEGIGY